MDRKSAELFGIHALNTVKDVRRILRRGTSAIYEDIATGRLKAIKIGGSTRITGELNHRVHRECACRGHYNEPCCEERWSDQAGEGEADGHRCTRCRDTCQAP